MSNKSIILDELLDVTGEIEQIKNRVNVLKDMTEKRMKRATSERDKMDIFAEFQGEISKIKKDGKLKSRYKELKAKQSVLKSKLAEKEKHISETNTDKSLKTNSDDIATSELSDEKNDVAKLISKYKNATRKPLKESSRAKTTRSPSTNTSHKRETSEDLQKKNDAKQIKKLHKLMESLRMNIND